MNDRGLASWKDGAVKQAIVDFVTSATMPGPEFVKVADRIATFDNDGTLWVEQPLPPQFDFVFRTGLRRSRRILRWPISSRTRRLLPETRRSLRAWPPRSRRWWTPF